MAAATTYPATFNDGSGVERFAGNVVFTSPTNQPVPAVNPQTSGALATISPSSGTALQVNATAQATLYVTYVGDATNNAATCTTAISPDNSTFSTIHSVSLAAAVNFTGAIQIPGTIVVPAGWYVKFTLSHMTLGNSNYA